MDKLVDLSQIIDHDMPVYPGDTKTSLFREKFLDRDGYNNYKLETGMHSGTHIDSPMHLTDSIRFISESPLESFFAPGCLLDVRNEAVIAMKPVYEETIREGSIVLLYTGYDRLYGTAAYFKEHPCVDMDFCRFLTERGIKMLGMDMPSPDRYPFEVHKALFEGGIHILENLTNLDNLIGAGDFEVIALPLRIRADSSVTRAVARVL